MKMKNELKMGIVASGISSETIYSQLLGFPYD